MKVTALDTLLAAKVINITPGLRPSERQVALALIEHFNRKTGRCDPGIERIASILGCCKRTVIRATDRLEKLGLVRKTRHGGYSNRNSYQPNWTRLAEQEAAWKTKLRSKSRRTSMSLDVGQEGHLQDDTPVTQTYSNNHPRKTYLGSPTKDGGAIRDSSPLPPRSVDAARVQAERRWSDELLRRYGSQPITYAEIVDHIDQDLRSSATEAEVLQRGSGLLTIERKLKLARE